MSNTIEKQVLDLGTLPTRGIDYWTPEEAEEMNNAKNGALVAAQEARTAKQETDEATARANEAATNANGAAGVAREEAGKAVRSATNAEDATVNANRAAADANRAYNTVTNYHDTVTVPDHNRAEQDHSRAEQDHTRHVEDHQEAVSQRAAEAAEFNRTQQENQTEFERTEKARQDEFDSKEAVRDAANAEAVRFAGNMEDVNRDMGKYQQLPDVTLTLVESGKRITKDGTMVADAAWNVGRLGQVGKGNIYELLMGGSDKMVLGAALFVSHTIERIGGQDKDVYKPIFSAVNVDLPISTYAVLLAVEDYSDVLVSYRNDVAGANVLKVARWGIFASIATQLANLRGDVDLKTFSDGYYDNMGVGFAKNLIGDGEATHEEFTERVAGGAHQIDDSIAEYSLIKGNSIVWNQLNKKQTSLTTVGITQVSTDDGITTINGTATEDALIYNIIDQGAVYKYLPSGHKGLFRYTVISGEFNGSGFWTYGQSGSFSFGSNTELIRKDTSSYRYFLQHIHKGDVFNNLKFRFQIFDLTQMFGEGNEPTLEQFKQWFPKDYYPYTEPHIVNMTAEGVKTTGRNLWDEEWESGSIGDNGELVPSTNSIRSKNKINVYGGEVYCVTYTRMGSSLLRIYFYDSNDSLLGVSSWLFPSETFSMPQNCAYVRFRLASAYGTTYKNDVCINVSDLSFNGQYEPHITSERKWTETMKKCFPDGMAKAGTAYDEFGATKAVKRIGVVDLGGLSWERVGYTGIYRSTTDIPFRVGTANGVASNGWPCEEAPGHAYTSDGFAFGSQRYNGEAYKNRLVAFSSADSESKVKEQMQGQYLYYELAEPIVITYDELNLTSRVWRDGMEEIIVPEGKESSPISADVIYQINAFKTIKANKQGIEELNAKPAIGLTAEEVAKIRALINPSTQNLEEE